MKHKLLFILLLSGFIAQGQLSPLSQASTSMPYGYLDVRSFGAIGDSSTVNTAAFRACAAACARWGTKMVIPSGNWVIDDSIIILPRVTVEGAGGSIITNDEAGNVTARGAVGFAQTNILCRGNNKSGFVVAPDQSGANAVYNPGSNFSNFSIRYQGTTPTSNAGIRMVDGGSYDMYNVSIVAFWIDLDVLASSYPHITGCTFAQYAYVGFHIANSYHADWGGTMISDTRILSGKYSTEYAGLLWEGNGAFRMSNCEFNITDLTFYAKYCVVLDNHATGPTQEIYFDNTSLSAFDSCAFKADNLYPGTKGIFLNNMLAYGPILDSLSQPAFQIGTQDPTTPVLNVVVSNIAAVSYAPPKAGNTYPVIRFTKCTELHVTQVSKGTYYAAADPVAMINCTEAYRPFESRIDYTDVDANGYAQNWFLKTPKSLTINTNALGSSYGPGFLFFKNGTTPAGYMDSLNRWGFGSSGLISAGGSMYNFFQINKDSNVNVAAFLRNNSNGASASARWVVNNGSNYGYLGEWGTAATAQKNISANNTAVYSSTGLDFLADGGSSGMTFGLNNGYKLVFASNDYFGFGVGTSPTALVDILGTTSAWNSFRIRSGATPSSPVDGSIYNNSTDHNLYFYNNSSFRQLSPTIGTATLVAGTKAITITGLSATSVAQVTLKTQGGTVTTTVQYEAVCTTNTLTINAVTNAGTDALNTTDTSIIQYTVFIQ